MAGLDPLAGIGKANVFEGNKALDFWRDDLKYARKQKAAGVKGKAAKQVKIKPLDEEVDGWRRYDVQETTEIYKMLQDEAVRIKDAGSDFRDNPEFMTLMDKTFKLAATNKEFGEQYDEDRQTVKGMLSEGTIDQDQFEEWEADWLEIANAGGNVDLDNYAPGAMKARADYVRENNLPGIPFEKVNLSEVAIDAITTGFTKIEDGDVTIDQPKKFEAQVKQVAKQLFEAGKRQGDWTTIKEAEDQVRKWKYEALDYTKSIDEEKKGLSLSWTAGGSTFGGITASTSTYSETLYDTASLRNVSMALDILENHPGQRDKIFLKDDGKTKKTPEELEKEYPDILKKHALSQYQDLKAIGLSQEKGQKTKQRPLRVTMLLDSGKIISQTEDVQVTEIIKKGDEYYVRATIPKYKQEAIGRLDKVGIEDIERDWLGMPIEEWFAEKYGKEDGGTEKFEINGTSYTRQQLMKDFGYTKDQIDEAVNLGTITVK